MSTSSRLVKDLVPAYVVDPRKSRFEAKATASGVLAAFGHNPTIAIRGFTGEAWFRKDAPEQSSLRIEIDAASLAVGGNINEKDRGEIERMMRQEVLEIDRYPQIRFEGTGKSAAQITEGMYRIVLDGKLALHGVERDVEVPCNVTVSPDAVRANGEFSIRQTDFHIPLVSVAGGALKLKDELKFTFDIAADRRREVANG